VGAYGFDFVLRVFDKNGTLLGNIGHTDGTIGIYGGSQELGFLGIASADPICHAQFGLYYDQQTAFGFEIDDLRIVPGGVTPVQQETWGHLKTLYRSGATTQDK